MLRITRMDRSRRTTLQLEGRLTTGELAALDEAWRAALAERRRVVLDLAGVRYVDAAGAALLRALREGPVELAGCSAFVRELLEEGRT
jgi:ABC-type transporter Mla MlaB component